MGLITLPAATVARIGVRWQQRAARHDPVFPP
jgi:hypothetical protein